ncbi:hypothetical protein SDC9_212228 [bioreactor metagenome]|uniref:Uncharacterized protein n=1 Tax=bioreactor metagenome TaxID=1076179 RepID=A0A645JM04_9ZZZZ
MVVAHQNRLNAISVAQPPQVFYGAVLPGYLTAGDLRFCDQAALRQLCPKRLGQVGHFIKGGYAAVEPDEDLAGAKRRLPHISQI